MNTHTSRYETGLPVLALHCSGGSPRQWEPLIAALAARHRMVVPELKQPPAGLPDPAAFTLADEAAPFLDQLDRLGAERFHLVGHSYGGTIALHIALNHPERVASLSLYEPSVFYLLDHLGESGQRAAEVIARFSDALARPWKAGLVEETARVFVAFWGGPDAWDAMSESARDATMAYLPRLDFEYHATMNELVAPRDYARVRAPALLMEGGAPGPNPARTAARSLRTVLPRAEWGCDRRCRAPRAADSPRTGDAASPVAYRAHRGARSVRTRRDRGGPVMTRSDPFHDADLRAAAYLDSLPVRPVFPEASALARLCEFDEPLPPAGRDAGETLRLLDEVGSPATVASNGPNYFGYVIGGTLPPVLAAQRLFDAWDQCASSFDNAPSVHKIEAVAADWLLDVLGLPRSAKVSFGTTTASCGFACLATARRALLRRQGWDIDRQGLNGAPRLRVVASEAAHSTIFRNLRLLGFGRDHVELAPVDAHGRVDPERLPALDERTLLCLQAGEVNTGEFDPFADIVPAARAAGAWIHVDGSFGLWARANPQLASLAEGVDGADSWTVDGHKWLNTPYDGAVGICRHGDALSETMNSATVYAPGSGDAQMNLGMEFSRRARGAAFWVALRSLGRDGLEEMTGRHCRHARMLADGLAQAGVEVLNRVILNQVLFRCATDEATQALRDRAVGTGRIWFGSTRWQGRVACRLSVSHWQSSDDSIEAALSVLRDALAHLRPASDAAQDPVKT